MHLADESASHGAVHPNGYSKPVLLCKIIVKLIFFPLKSMQSYIL